MRKSDFYEDVEIVLKPLPPWSKISTAEWLEEVKQMLEDITKEAALERLLLGKKVLGRKKVKQVPITKRYPPAKPPWWQERRKQIVAWAQIDHPETRTYLDLYWTFQEQFREASQDHKDMKPALFPKHAWIPATFNPPERQNQFAT